MAIATQTTAARGRFPFSAGTAAAVGVAAAAMVATLPGRTHGLGLITEPLLQELALGHVPFAALNFWATLIGAAFCVPVGWALDRFGVRVALAAVLLALGATVLAMAGAATGGRPLDLPAPEFFFGRGLEWSAVPLDLFVLVLLTRGLGQSALSVVSLALIGKVAGRTPGLAMGAYSFLVSLGFMAAFGSVGAAFEQGADWRTVWAEMGWVLIACGALALLFVRNPRQAEDVGGGTAEGGARERSYTLSAALLTPGFWVFGLATSFYGMVAAGTSLFNQSLLVERGFDQSVLMTVTTAAPMIGLVANLGTGWLATRVRLGALLAGSMLLLAAALACFPAVSSLAQVYAYAAVMGVSGGVLTVTFFAVWRQAYGPTHLGKIQGVAQLLTVLASAGGPLVLATGHRAYGSYSPVVEARARGRRLRRGRVARAPSQCVRSPARGETRMTATATDEELHTAYARNGFVVVRSLFSDAEMRAASAEADRLLAEHAHLKNVKNIRCRWQDNVFTGECTFETFDPVIDIGPMCDRLAHHPALLAVLATVYGEPARLFKDKLIFKPPGVKGYGLHQDWIAWDGFPESFLTVLIPFDAANRDNGCTVVYPGYHTGGSLSPRDGQYHELPAGTVDEARAVPLLLEPGDVAVFGGFTPHRSDPNVSDRWRRQLYLSYNALSDGGDQRAKHYREFHAWLRTKYAEYGKTDTYFA